jgi:hypothetical protein
LVDLRNHRARGEPNVVLLTRIDSDAAIELLIDPFASYRNTDSPKTGAT